MWDEITYFFNNIITTLKDWGLWLLGLLYEALLSVCYWIFDKLCDLVEWILSGIDFSLTLFQNAISWSGVPGEVIWLCNQIGVDDGLLMISTALIIRLTLNIIPASLTRV